jgi:hypothetical protein
MITVPSRLPSAFHFLGDGGVTGRVKIQLETLGLPPATHLHEDLRI